MVEGGGRCHFVGCFEGMKASAPCLEKGEGGRVVVIIVSRSVAVSRGRRVRCKGNIIVLYRIVSVNGRGECKN